MRRRWRGAARRVARRLGDAALDLGVRRYRPERWTTEAWADAYRAGRLEYYGQLDELGRYSALLGYLSWFAEQRDDRPWSVLDVGCGTGLLRRRMAGLPFERYVGVDLSEDAVAAARATADPRDTFVVGDAGELDLGRFDVIVLNEVLYYAPDPEAFLARLATMLVPGGVLLVSMWRHPGDRQLWDRVRAAFTPVDEVEVRNRRNRVNPAGWTVACLSGGR